MHLLVLAMVALLAEPARALAASSGKLARLLSKGKPLLVEVRDDAPKDAWHLDVEDVSRGLRTAGATALLTQAALLNTIAEEQLSARGNFPGPLPVLCEISSAEEVDAAREAGAAGVAICWPDGHKVEALLAASIAAGLDCLVVAGDAEVAATAAAAGAAAVACAYEGATPADVDVPAVLAAWDGEDDGLAEQRASGFEAMVLIDGCRGDIAANGAWCESRVGAFRSKASKQWGGSMFASTSSDVAPPSVRNPRAWAQSQRQAREIMHESAASRGLPPPKLKRNTVL